MHAREWYLCEVGHIHGGERRLGSFAEIEKDGGVHPQLFTFVDKVCKKSFNSMQKILINWPHTSLRTRIEMKDPKNWGHMTIPLLRQNDMESGMWCFSLSWRLSMPAFPRKQNSWESILLILIWTIFYLIYRLKFFKMSGEWDTFYEGHVEREWFNPVRASSRSGSSQKKGKGVHDSYIFCEILVIIFCAKNTQKCC